MIQYALKCDNDHHFDSWFQSFEAYETLKAADLVTCAVCGSTAVEKSLMAPRVRPARSATTSRMSDETAQGPSRHADAAQSSRAHGPLSTPASPAEQALAEMRRKVEETSDYVGLKFAAEARAIHDGTAPERPIYGEAKLEDAKALVEDGVPVLPLPFRPARKSN